MASRAKVIFGPRGSDAFQDKLNLALEELEADGCEIVSISGITDVNMGWTCTVLYRTR